MFLQPPTTVNGYISITADVIRERHALHTQQDWSIAGEGEQILSGPFSDIMKLSISHLCTCTGLDSILERELEPHNFFCIFTKASDLMGSVGVAVRQTAGSSQADELKYPFNTYTFQMCLNWFNRMPFNTIDSIKVEMIIIIASITFSNLFQRLWSSLLQFHVLDSIKS